MDFYKFLAINFAYLGNKTINSVLKDILYHLHFISNKLMLNAETQRFFIQGLFMFLWSLCYKATPWENYVALNPVLGTQFGCLKENMSDINPQFHIIAISVLGDRLKWD